MEAQRAAARFDQSTLFSIVKRLKFKSSLSVTSVLLEDGRPASSHHEEQSRLVETLCETVWRLLIELVAKQGVTAGNLSSAEMLDQVEVIAGLPKRKAQGEDYSQRNSEGWWTACVLAISTVVFQGK